MKKELKEELVRIVKIEKTKILIMEKQIKRAKNDLIALYSFQESENEIAAEQEYDVDTLKNSYS